MKSIARLKGKEYVCLVGDTKATIEASGAKFTHTIILMHDPLFIRLMWCGVCM